jgi:ribose 5-phosphate isomerase B
MRVYLATDHAGFSHKELLKDHLQKKGIEVIDCGAKAFKDGDAYPPYISEAARNVQADAFHAPALAIVFGGSGQGEAIVANRFPHVRAIVYAGGSLELVKLGKEHNDANVLSIGARFCTEDQMIEAVETFLNTSFSHDERHVERILEIEEDTKQL